LQIAEGEGSGPRGSGHVECVGERPGSCAGCGKVAVHMLRLGFYTDAAT
jgi:hypothetical protein